MTIKVNKHSIDETSVLYELIKAHGKSVVSGVTALTDNSGGSAGTTVVNASTALVNVADAGTTTASKATAESALTTVKDALLELATKANEYATKLGIDTVTYNGGGSAADGTVGAITVSTTAATTGAQATETNATIDTLNDAFFVVGTKVNQIATALGVSGLTLPAGGTYASTVAAITVAAGTAGDPGVTKVALDAELVKLANNVKAVATVLNTFNDGVTAAAVVIN